MAFTMNEKIENNDAQEIKSFFKGDVEASDAVLAEYSHDTSLFTVRPTLVIFRKIALIFQS